MISTIESLLNCIKDLAPVGDDPTTMNLAIRAVRNDPDFFLGFLSSKDRRSYICLDIYRRMVQEAEKLWLKLDYEEAFRKISRDSIMEEANLISSAIDSIRKSIKTERTPAAKTRSNRGAVDLEFAFRGLEMPDNPLPDTHFCGLTLLQKVCLQLKYDHSQSFQQVADRMKRSKSTVEGIHKTANKRMGERDNLRIKERSRLR